MTVYELWLPVVLTGLANHVFSTLAWVALPHHKPEWQRVPGEDDLQDFLAGRQVPSGQYIFPYAANGTEAKSEEFQGKLGKCRGMLILWSTPTHMGRAILQTLISFFVIAFCVGYLASLALPRGAETMKVIQFATTAGLLAHVSAKFPFVFWFRRKISMDVLDGVVHALITGLIFAAFWPK